MKLIKPNKIIIGDTIAIVSPSWGGPASFPHIYESGIKILENLGFKIKEYPTARMDADQLYNRPQLRAMDINDAFADTEVKAIFTSIGGEDSVRILPFLDVEVIKKNPKILLGYSDTTTLTAYLNQLGLITFNGPSIMSGFSQWESLGKQFQQHILTFLFGEITNVNYPTYENYSEGYPNWDDKNNIGKINELKENIGWHWLQGSTITTGKLFGGCIEVLQIMNGTDFWPQKNFWQDKILFLETSEDKPSVNQIKFMLRNYGVQGVFAKISGLMIGRAIDYSEQEQKKLDETIIQVVKNEFSQNELPIISHMDFGHTNPQFILPLGIDAEINPIEKTFKLLESPFK